MAKRKKKKKIRVGSYVITHKPKRKRKSKLKRFLHSYDAKYRKL